MTDIISDELAPALAGEEPTMPEPHTFDMTALIRDAVDRMNIEIEQHAEHRVAAILRERGWTCTPPGEQTDTERELLEVQRNATRLLWHIVGEAGITISAAALRHEEPQPVQILHDYATGGITVRRYDRDADVTPPDESARQERTDG